MNLQDQIAYAENLAKLAPEGPSVLSSFRRGLCADCKTRFIDEAPEIPPVPFAGISFEDLEALPSGLHDRALQGHEEVTRVYDRDFANHKRDFPPCPHDDAPVFREKPSSDGGTDKIRQAVLKALDVGGSMSATQIGELGIKGLDKNNRPQVMAALVEGGLVTLHQQGTAKFYTIR